MAAPKLQLDVTLNLAAFRKDLGKVAQAAAAYYYPINLLINKKNYEAQLKTLSKIKPVINIEDSQLIGARARIATLNKSLATLRRATAAPIEIKIKYTEVGKAPSGATAQIGKAVSGGIKAEQALQGLSYKQAQAARQMMVAANIPVGALGKNRSLDAYMKSLVEGMTNAGEQSITGLAQGLKDGKSAIGQAAKNVGESGLRALKDFWGIASPSRVFKQIGEFAVDGLELGFLNGLKDFKTKSISEVRKITAALKFELAKINAFVIGNEPPLPRVTGPQGPWRQSWSQFLQQRQQPSRPQGSRAYTSPIGPLPLNSQDPWAPEGAGYTPRLASSVYQRTPQFPMSGMMGPSSPNPSYVPRNSFLAFSQRATQVTQQAQARKTGGGAVPPSGFPVDDAMITRAVKLGTVMDIASESTKNFRANQIPLIGGIKGLASEFGEATKQVLLYGTAYKGLAFITSLPGQVLNAAKSQQQFNNALQTATQDTGTFAKELLYVDNVQRAFGLNLETTRTGFTKLYASMAPTGFDSGSIEKLFTGISAATAALQLTPDKAERVIYAFGQMASKGQIMSEELKGQLGDVLPGALALFAKAAGMSVKQFSEAMEDGEFTGNRFREVFAKVSDELMVRFGTGAQAAGKSLQGLINTVGGDFKRTLESFAPLANAAAQATLGPLSRALKEISMAAQIAMGEQDRVGKQLKAAQSDLSALQIGGADAKEIKAAEQNVAALKARYAALNEAAKDPAIAQQVKNIEAFVTEVQKAATFTMNLVNVIGNILNPLITLLGGNFTSVIGNLALLALGFNAAKLAVMLFMGTVSTMSAISGLSASGAAGATLLAGAFKLVGVQATGAQVATLGFGAAVKGLLASTGIGLLVVLLGSLAASALSVGDAFSEAAMKSKQAIDEMKDAVRTGNVELAKSRLASAKQARNDIEEQVKWLNSMKALFETKYGGKGRPVVQTSLSQRMQLETAGFNLKGQTEVDLNDLLGQVSQLRATARNLEQRGVVSVRQAQERAGRIGINQPTPGISLPEETEKDETRVKSLESYHSLADQLAKDSAEFAAAQTEEEFRHKIELLELYYDIQEARANAYQKEALRFEREMMMIEAKRREARLKAELEVQKAQSSVAGGAAMTGGTGAIFGATGRTFNAPGWVHGHFQNQNREALVQDTVEVVMNLLSQGVSPELGSGARFKAGMSQGQVEGLVRQGIASHKQYASGIGAIDVFVPAGTNVPVPVSGISNLGGAAGVSGTLSRGTQLMHLDPRSISAGAPRKVPASEKRDALAEQNTLQAAIAKTATERMADAKAAQEQIVAFERYKAAAFPTAEQELQNNLLAKRNELFRSGATEDQIEKEIKLFENQEKGRFGLEAIARLEAKGIITKKQAAELTRQLNSELAKQNGLIEQQVQLTQQQKFDETIRNLRDQIALLRTINDEEARRLELQKAGYSAAQIQQIIDLEEVKKNLENVRAAIDDFVTSTSSDYKGFFKAVLFGEDPVEALKEFQKRLADKVLTIFLDFTMAPVEEFFKESLRNIFIKKPEEEKKVEAEKTVPQNVAQIATDVRTIASSLAGGGQAANANQAVQNIGGTATEGGNIVSGDVANSIKQANEKVQEEGATFRESLNKAVGAIGVAAGSIMGIAAGISQIKEGGTANVLSGIGSILMSVGGGIGGFTKLFAADGGIATGGWKPMPITPFATGGMVNGPTLGLVGEGRYNEAIVPLPNGRSIPVEFNQKSSLRDAMGQSSSSAVAPVLNMSFQSTTINGVEYVSRDQLEQAMSQTRRQASREGAQRGMSMTLDKLQQSPSTRSRLGIR